jgi:hypothetical protein
VTVARIVFQVAVIIYFGVILYGELRNGHWLAAAGTTGTIFILAALFALSRPQ